MGKKILFTSLLFVLMLFYGNNIQAQDDQGEDNSQETEVVIYELKETPAYCFYKHKNPFLKFDEEQILVLDLYEYPKFSRNSDNALELDIKLWKEARKQWDVDNESRINEIYDAMNISK